jgi:hypothetical protein
MLRIAKILMKKQTTLRTVFMAMKSIKIYLVIIFRTEIMSLIFQCFPEIIDDLGHIIKVNDVDVIIFMMIMRRFISTVENEWAMIFFFTKLTLSER